LRVNLTQKNLCLRFLKDKGISIVEILVAIVIITIVFISGLMIFSTSTLRIARQSAEKTINQQATDFTLFLRNKLKEAIIRDIPGPFRIDFVGTETSIKFVAPYSSGNGSDIGKYGIYYDGNEIKMSFERIDEKTNTYSFEPGFTGSQLLIGNVKKLSFSYWDGKTWQKFWNTKNQVDCAEIPSKIKVFFVIYGGNIEGKMLEKGFSEEIWLGQ